MNTKSFVKRAVALAVLTGAAVGAHATVSPNEIEAGLITHLTPYDIQTMLAPGAFYDIYKFTLPANSSSTYSVIDFPIGASFKTIWSGGALSSNPDGIVGNTDDDAIPGASMVSSLGGKKLSLTMGPLAAGNYYLSVVGMATGTSGGLYTGSITMNPPVTPVPEPESYAMLLAGLGIIGTIAVRRNNSKKQG